MDVFGLSNFREEAEQPGYAKKQLIQLAVLLEMRG